MKRIITIFICLCVIFSLNACSSTSHQFDTLDNYKYLDYDELMKYTVPSYITGMQSNLLNVDDFISQDITNVITDKMGDNYYSLMKINSPENKQYLLFLLYDSEYYLKESIYTSRFYSEEDFSLLTIGGKKSEVESIVTLDMNEYYFSDDFSESIFWLKNNKMIIIDYQSDIISNIETINDEYKIYQFLNQSKIIDLENL